MTENASGVVNLFFCGVGGQGILLASEIASEVAFLRGLDVKKSEVHGMAQRGGSVSSNVRFGPKVYSPLIRRGEVDYLISFHTEERDRWRHMLEPGGKIVEASPELVARLPNPRCHNVALLGSLSCLLEFSEEEWKTAIQRKVRERFVQINLTAFAMGKEEAATDANR